MVSASKSTLTLLCWRLLVQNIPTAAMILFLRLRLWLLSGELDATLIAVLEALLMFSLSRPDSNCPTQSISESLASPPSRSTLTSMLSAQKDYQFVCSEIKSCVIINSSPHSHGMEDYTRLQPLLVVVLALSLLAPGLQ